MALKTERQHAPKKTILIVDDHPMLRRGLKALIESEADLAVYSEADTCDTALVAIAEDKPDLVVVDLALANSDGLDLVKDMRRQYPAIPALILTMHDETVYAERALRAGARGYITKQQLDNTILVAIRRLLDGGTYMSDRLQGRLAEKFVGGHALQPGPTIDALSDRELQVFRLIGQGQTTRQIAAAFCLSIKTIESHRAHIKSKLSIESSAELAQRATRWVETGHND